MKQNEERTVKGVISIEEYLKKLKSNKNIYPEKRGKGKSSALMLAELYM